MRQKLCDATDHMRQTICDATDHMRQTICDATYHMTQTICDATDHMRHTICDATDHMRQTICDATDHMRQTICDATDHMRQAICDATDHMRQTQLTQFLNRRTQLVLPPSKWSPHQDTVSTLSSTPYLPQTTPPHYSWFLTRKFRGQCILWSCPPCRLLTIPYPEPNVSNPHNHIHSFITIY